MLFAMLLLQAANPAIFVSTQNAGRDNGWQELVYTAVVISPDTTVFAFEIRETGGRVIERRVIPLSPSQAYPISGRVRWYNPTGTATVAFTVRDRYGSSTATAQP